MVRIKAVLFDLGNTIIDYGPVKTAALFRESARRSYDYLQGRYADLMAGVSFGSYFRRHYLAIRWNVVKTHLTGREFDCREVLARQLRRWNIRLTPDELKDLTWQWYEPLARCGVVEEDLAEHLRALQEMGLQLAIVSNTFLPGATLDRHLQQYDLERFFPVRLYSSATVVRKPNPAFFQLALERLGVRAEEAIMIGDLPKIDIRGALRAGLHPVWKRSSVNGSKSVAAHIPTIRTLGELPDLIRQRYAVEGFQPQST